MGVGVGGMDVGVGGRDVTVGEAVGGMAVPAGLHALNKSAATTITIANEIFLSFVFNSFSVQGTAAQYNSIIPCCVLVLCCISHPKCIPTGDSTHPRPAPRVIPRRIWARHYFPPSTLLILDPIAPQ